MAGGKLLYIKEQVVLGTTPGTPDTGYCKLYRNSNNLWYEVDDAGQERIANWDRLKPIVVSQQAIVTHLDLTNPNTSTNALTQAVNLPYDGDYLMTLSFNFNVDSNAAYGRVYATLGGNALDLNDRSADPQGNNQILVVEMKDNGNTAGGPITGTGSGNKMPYMMQFYITGQSAGIQSLVIDVGCQTANVEASIWNIVAKFEIVNLT